MEKLHNKKDKTEKMKNRKDSQKQHHHRRASIDKINSRFLDIMQKTKYQKSDNKIQEMQFKINNKLNLKEEKKTGIVIKDGKHKRNASNISTSEFEKNYIKNKIENFEKAIKNEDKKNNNMKNNKIDFKIINNNKPNYNEGNKINTYTPINAAKKSQNNLKSSFITNYMKNSNEMQQKNIKNKNSLFQSQISITNDKTNYKINETYEKKKDNNIKYIHKNNSVILEENYEEKNPKKNKEKQNKKIKSKESEIIQKEEIEKNIKSKSQIKEKQPKNSEINNNLKISLKYNNKDKKELIEKEAQKKLIKKQIYQNDYSKEKDDFKSKINSYLSKYIDFNSIADKYPGGYNYLLNKLKYLNLQCNEDEYNFIYSQKNLYKSQDAKDLCRKGIPIKYIKSFLKKLLKLENCKENYDFKYAMVMKELDTNYIGDYVPYYYGKTKTKLKEILQTHYLNDEGIKQLKTIMWLISDLVPKIEYSPFLVKICAILLIFFDKEETFEAMRTLIEMNYDPKDIYKLRWHFRYSIDENDKLVDSITIFLENQSDKIKELFEIFKSKGLQPLVLIRLFVESLFLDFLNFYGIIRFICIFLYEGVKSLYRISFGILNYIYDNNLEEIKNCKVNILSKLKEIIYNTFDYNKIFEDSFTVQLSRFNNGYIKDDNGEDIAEFEIPFECSSKYNNQNSGSESNPEKDKEEEEAKEIEKEKERLHRKKHNYLSHFYLPSIEPKSNILTSKYIFKLWPKLPKKFKNCNLATIYSLSRKKINMKSIIELSHKYPKNYRILILIETEQEELFGIILPQMLEDTGEEKYIKLEKCYLINFLPKVNIYKDQNEIKCQNMLCCNKKGLWFCKEQVGDLIFIDGTLTEGKICKDNTYFGKISLTKKSNFLVKDFEIIVFVENDI